MLIYNRVTFFSFVFLCLHLAIPNQLRGELFTSYKGTFGTDHYYSNNLDAFVNLPLGFNLGFTYNSYKADTTNGTTSTYIGSMGWWHPKGAVNLTISGTPELNGYKRNSIGLDGSVRVLNTIPIRAYLLAGFNSIAHTDGTTTVQQRVGKRAIQTITTDNEIKETDYTVGGKLKYYNTTVLTKFIKSTYDQDNFQTSRTAFGTASIPDLRQTYPNQTAFIKVNQDVYSWLWLYSSYTHEQFKFGQIGIANSYLLGFGIGWKQVEWLFEYTRYDPSDEDSGNYYSLGIGLKFG